MAEERVWLKQGGAGDSGPGQPCSHGGAEQVAGGSALPAAPGSWAFSSSVSAAQQVVQWQIVTSHTRTGMSSTAGV